MRAARSTLLAALLLLPITASGQQVAESPGGPLAYVLPATDRVVVVLGDTPREAWGFQVLRRGPGDSDLRPLTPGPVQRSVDANEACRLMGGDFDWIARRFQSNDPETLWRRIVGDRPMAMTLAMVSHGLRLALGRTLVDLGVRPGESYAYRVIVVDRLGKEIGRLDRQLKVTAPLLPPAPRELRAEAGDGAVNLSWDYPAYKGGEDDRTVAFVITRQEQGGTPRLVSPAPVFRIEGHLSYHDSDAANGRTYTYGIEALDIIGARSPRAASKPVTPRDTTAPLVPVGLTAVDSKDGVLLVWRTSPDLDAATYNVWRSNGLESDAVRINPAPIPRDQPRFVDEEPARGTPQYYWVAATDASGNESKRGGPVTIIPLDTEPPPRVEGLEASLDEDKRIVRLAWKPSPSPDLKGYHVYRADKGDAMARLNGAPLEAGRRPTYEDGGYKQKGLVPGAKLVYAVTAVDQSYNESEKALLEVTVPDKVAPPPPLSASARPTDEGHVLLSWQRSLARDITRQRIYRSEEQKKKAAVVAELERDAATWIDRSVARGRPYFYRITAVDAAGNESEPSPEMRVVPTDVRPPPQPLDLDAEVERGGVRLRWQPPPADDVADYVVYRSLYKGGRWERLTREPIDRAEYLDRDGRAGVRYAVSARDTSGNEGARAEAAAHERVR